jgi:hypothetical protein
MKDLKPVEKKEQKPLFSNVVGAEQTPAEQIIAEQNRTLHQAPTDMVQQAFNAAVVNTVQNDVKVQEELLESAEKVIHNKTSEIKAQAEKEEKEAYFNNKKSACECFGYNETTTEKWAVSIMGVWHNVITAIWLVLGALTFAPITFVAKKISVIIKSTWLAVVFAVIIYLAVATSPYWVGLLNQLGGVQCVNAYTKKLTYKK